MPDSPANRDDRNASGIDATQKSGEIRYDAVLKDLFQSDSPTLLDELSGGRRILHPLNVEFASVIERRADLAFLLEGGEILHLDFQSYYDPGMPYREGIYGLMIAGKYRCTRLHQVVLYAGRGRMRMRNALDLGGIRVSYRLIDVGEIEAETLLRSRRPGDCVLALLARGGAEQLRKIIRQAKRYPESVRHKVLAQLVVLSGLRRLSIEVKMEMMRAGIERTIDEHAYLRDLAARKFAEGREHGRQEGRQEGRRGRSPGRARGGAAGSAR